MGIALNVERAYRDHGHIVVRRARRILGDESEAREVLQEVFLSLLDRPGQFRGKSSLTTFLYRMTTNNCLNRLRNTRRREDLVAAREVASDSVPARSDAAAEANQLLRELPEKLARVAVHLYIDEMTHEEVSEILGCSRRMVGKLAKKLENEIAQREAA